MIIIISRKIIYIRYEILLYQDLNIYVDIYYILKLISIFEYYFAFTNRKILLEYNAKTAKLLIQLIITISFVLEIEYAR